jgi:hypothetical protein
MLFELHVTFLEFVLEIIDHFSKLLPNFLDTTVIFT